MPRLNGQTFHDRAQANAAAHRMGKQEVGARKVQFACRPHQGGNVLLIILKSLYMPDQRIMDQPVGKTLTPPVDGNGCQTSFSELTCRDAVFLDIFRPARKQQDRSLGTGQRPMADPDPLAIGCLDPMGGPACGAGTEIRKKWGRIEFHQPRTEASFIAIPISPSTLSLPVMKADVGFVSPSRID